MLRYVPTATMDPSFPVYERDGVRYRYIAATKKNDGSHSQ